MKIGGPWGGLIGAAAGGIAGIFGGIFRTKSARRRLRRIQEAERYNNTMKDKQVQGVLICNTLEEAKAGVKEIMEDKKFGASGASSFSLISLTGRSSPSILILFFSA